MRDVCVERVVKTVDNMRNLYFHVKSRFRYSDFDQLRILSTGEQRRSADIDFVVRRDIPNDEFLDKGYRCDFYSDKLYTPRGIKIDLYKKRDLAGIPLDYIRKTAVSKYANGVDIDIISLEGLILSKHRAGRNVDMIDLQSLVTNCGHQINWLEIENLAKSDVELSELKDYVDRNL